MFQLKVQVVIFLLVMSAVSCRSPVNFESEIIEKSDTLPLPFDSTTLYFQSVGKGGTEVNLVRANVNPYYSWMLYKFNEPVLKDYHGSKEVYRFTWLRSFNHPVVVRVEKHAEIISISGNVSNGAGGFGPGEIIFDTTFSGTLEHIDTISGILSSAGFWSLDTESKDNIGLDGSKWIIEAYKNHQYHVVVRWSPAKGIAFRRIGEYLISISGIKNENGEDIDY
jgi:hypothetical protein